MIRGAPRHRLGLPRRRRGKVDRTAAVAAALLALAGCCLCWPAASPAAVFEDAGRSVDKGLRRAREGLAGLQRRVAPQNQDTLERQVDELKAAGKRLVKDAQAEGEAAVIRAEKYLDKAKGEQKKVAERALDKAKADADLAIEKAEARAKRRVKEVEQRLKRLM